MKEVVAGQVVSFVVESSARLLGCTESEVYAWMGDS